MGFVIDKNGEYLPVFGETSGGGGSYVLPVATTSVLGGVKIDDSTITINDGVISLKESLLAQLNYKVPNVEITGLVPISQNNIINNFHSGSCATVLKNTILPTNFDLVIDCLPKAPEGTDAESILFASTTTNYIAIGVLPDSKWTFVTGNGTSWYSSSTVWVDQSVSFGIEYLVKFSHTPSGVTLYSSNDNGTTWKTVATAPAIPSFGSSNYHLGNNRVISSVPWRGAINLENSYIKNTSDNTFVWKGTVNKIGE